MMRLKLAYNESLFGWAVNDKAVVEVMSNTMSNWFGYDSIVVG